MPKHPNKTVQLSGFQGINNRLRPERTPLTFLKEALNVDIDKSGGIRTRQGYVKLEDGDFHSLWSDGDLAYVVKDGGLFQILPSLELIDLNYEIEGLIRFWRVDETTYFIGEHDKGRIVAGDVLPWGISRPNPSPTLSEVSGTLTAGQYQIAITYVDIDGLESGAGVAGTISVGVSTGILLSNIPTSSDPRVEYVRVYASTPDGDQLYAVKEIVNGTSSTVVASVSGGVRPLVSFNKSTPPNGQVLAHYNGRMLIGSGEVLWFSEPYSHHWFDYQANYQLYPETIKAILPVENGVWVAADKIYFLSGEDITTARRDTKEPAKAVIGTEVTVPGHFITIENTPLGYKWLITTDRGIFICFNQGVILNMLEANYSIDKGSIGSGAFVQEGGINKYVPIISKKKDSENTAVGDMVSAEIIRNGITLEV